MMAKLFSHLPLPGVPGSSVIIGGPPCAKDIRVANVMSAVRAKKRRVIAFVFYLDRKPAISAYSVRSRVGLATYQARDLALAETAPSAGKFDVSLDRAQ